MTDFFPYRDGELVRRRRCRSRASPPRSARRSTSIPPAPSTARYRAFADAFAPARPLICYAVKANSNLAVLRLFAGLGAGADVVSEGELRRALAAGIPPQRIVFSGVGKTRAELDAALAAGIHQINVESVPELRRLSEVGDGARHDRPDRDPGQSGCRCADPRQDLDRQARKTSSASTSRTRSTPIASPRDLPGIEPVGLAVHIGSQIAAVSARSARLSSGSPSWCVELRAGGLAVRRLDLGGGLGIRYHDETPPRARATMPALVRDIFGALDVELAFEPGRVLVGPAGIAGRAGDLRQGGRDQAVRHRRCGDERSDPAGAVRGLARHRPGAAARRRRRAEPGRCRRPGLRDRRHLCHAAATCRRWPRAIWWRSTVPGPMAR